MQYSPLLQSVLLESGQKEDHAIEIELDFLIM
jgi:hypothetical protein